MVAAILGRRKENMVQPMGSALKTLELGAEAGENRS